MVTEVVIADVAHAAMEALVRRIRQISVLVACDVTVRNRGRALEVTVAHALIGVGLLFATK